LWKAAGGMGGRGRREWRVIVSPVPKGEAPGAPTLV